MKKFKTLLLAMCAATLASISISAYANEGASYMYENLPKNLDFPVNVVIEGDGATFMVESQEDPLSYNGESFPHLNGKGQEVVNKITSLGSNYGCKFTGNLPHFNMWLEGKCDR